MKLLKALSSFLFSAHIWSFISLFYMFFYWFLLIFLKDEKLISLATDTKFLSFLIDPATFLVAILISLMCTAKIGYITAVEEVMRSKTKALFEIYKKKQELVNHVNLSRLVVNKDAEELVKDFLEKIVKENKLQP